MVLLWADSESKVKALPKSAGGKKTQEEKQKLEKHANAAGGNNVGKEKPGSTERNKGGKATEAVTRKA